MTNAVSKCLIIHSATCQYSLFRRNRFYLIPQTCNISPWCYCRSFYWHEAKSWIQQRARVLSGVVPNCSGRERGQNHPAVMQQQRCSTMHSDRYSSPRDCCFSLYMGGFGLVDPPNPQSSLPESLPSSPTLHPKPAHIGVQ